MRADTIVAASTCARGAKTGELDRMMLCMDEQRGGGLLSHGMAEVARVARLAVVLLSNLGLGWKWLCCLAQLVCFAGLLLPGFARVVLYYGLSRDIRRSVVYGPHPRNRMDIYLPARSGLHASAPVVVYVTGGAWIIGYKAWGALLARRISMAGAVVCCLDYRNFPQGTILDMIEDVSTAMKWVTKDIHTFGGDSQNMVVVGQSAGAQLAALAVLFQGRGCNAPQTIPAQRCKAWSMCQAKAYVGLSGAYDIPGLVDHLDDRGLHRALFKRIMAQPTLESMDVVSPLQLLAECDRGVLPAFHLIHGEVDRSVPLGVALNFADALQEHGCPVTLTVIEGKSHTQLMIEDSLRGGPDRTVELILATVKQRQVMTSYSSSVPGLLVKLASAVCPF